MSQLARFARLFVFAALPALITVATDQSKWTVAGVTVVIVAAAETAWRQLKPTVPAPKALPPAKP